MHPSLSQSRFPRSAPGRDNPPRTTVTRQPHTSRRPPGLHAVSDRRPVKSRQKPLPVTPHESGETDMRHQYAGPVAHGAGGGREAGEPSARPGASRGNMPTAPYAVHSPDHRRANVDVPIRADERPKEPAHPTPQTSREPECEPEDMGLGTAGWFRQSKSEADEDYGSDEEDSWNPTDLANFSKGRSFREAEFPDIHLVRKMSGFQTPAADPPLLNRALSTKAVLCERRKPDMLPGPPIATRHCLPPSDNSRIANSTSPAGSGASYPQVVPPQNPGRPHRPPRDGTPQRVFNGDMRYPTSHEKRQCVPEHNRVYALTPNRLEQSGYTNLRDEEKRNVSHSHLLYDKEAVVPAASHSEGCGCVVC